MINSIIHGDCLEVMQDIPAGSVDMILCDLPYSLTSNSWDMLIPFEPLWEQYLRISKPSAPFLLFGQEPFTSKLILSNEKMFKYSLYWDKINPRNFLNARKQPMRVIEQIACFYSEQPVYNPILRDRSPINIAKIGKSGRPIKNYGNNNYGKTPDIIYRHAGRQIPVEMKYPDDLITIGVINPGLPEKEPHPTQKPVALFEYLIKTYTNPGMIILDNCAGSGTTAIAAMNLKRNFICIEKDNHYYEVAKNRIKNHRVQEQLFLT